MATSRDRVQSFFDRLAPSYRSRYEGAQPFLAYLHRERLDKALEGLELSGKTVLDIGAGTGILYDELQSRSLEVDYFACDISAAMLAYSRIPEDQRWVGAPQDCAFPVPKFEVVFALGVTTYLTESELKELLGYLTEHLAAGGQAVLSFSNPHSLDFRLRRWIGKLIPRHLFPGSLLGQEFSANGFSPEAVRSMLPAALQISALKWLNATVFPFSRLFPAWSVRLSKGWLARPVSDRKAGFFCSDYLMILRASREA